MVEMLWRMFESMSFRSGIHFRLNVRMGHEKEDVLVEEAERMSGWIVGCFGRRRSFIVMTFIAIRKPHFIKNVKRHIK